MKLEQIYTIGYRGRAPEDFWHTLTSNGVDVLVDVRHNAHWPPNHWSKKALVEGCRHHRLYYAHLPQYGIPNEIRRQEDLSREALLTWYERRIRAMLEDPAPRPPGEGTELQPLLGILGPEGGFHRPCLLCAEASADECHRGRLAAIVGELLDRPVIHL